MCLVVSAVDSLVTCIQPVIDSQCNSSVQTDVSCGQCSGQPVQLSLRQLYNGCDDALQWLDGQLWQHQHTSSSNSTECSLGGCGGLGRGQQVDM